MTTDQSVLDKLAELNAFGNERLQMHAETLYKVNSGRGKINHSLVPIINLQSMLILI